MKAARSDLSGGTRGTHFFQSPFTPLSLHSCFYVIVHSTTEWSGSGVKDFGRSVSLKCATIIDLKAPEISILLTLHWLPAQINYMYRLCNTLVDYVYRVFNVHQNDYRIVLYCIITGISVNSYAALWWLGSPI